MLRVLPGCTVLGSAGLWARALIYLPASRRYFGANGISRVTSLALVPARELACAPVASRSRSPRHGRPQQSWADRQKPYVTAGTRTYVIGTQDGNFPDLGEHLPGEMGGAWLHPIKLIDGFSATVAEPATRPRVRALRPARTSSPTPTATDSTTARCWTASRSSASSSAPTAARASSSSTSFGTPRPARATLSFRFAVKTDLRPVWFSEQPRHHRSLRTPRAGSRRPGLRRQGHRASLVLRLGSAGSADAQPVAASPADRDPRHGGTAASRYTVSVAATRHLHPDIRLRGIGTGQERRGRDLARVWPGDHASLLAEQKAHYASLLEGRVSPFPTGACRRSTTG